MAKHNLMEVLRIVRNLAFSSTGIFFSTIQREGSSTFGGEFWQCSAEIPTLLEEGISKVLRELGRLYSI